MAQDDDTIDNPVTDDISKDTTEDNADSDSGSDTDKGDESTTGSEDITVEVRQADDDTKIEYGDNVDPDDVKTIEDIVDKKTMGVKKTLKELQDMSEIDSFVAQNPEYAKYKGAIIKHWQDPVYNRIPVKRVAVMIASEDLIKLGAQKEREAQIKADSTKTTGSTVRTQDMGTKDWSKASKEDFEAQKRKVLGQHI
jgi:hypothetical protein